MRNCISETIISMFLPAGPSGAVGLVVDVVPGDHVTSAGGGGLSNGEGESLLEGSLQELQNLPAHTGVWEEGCAGCPFVRLAGIGVLLLSDSDEDQAKVHNKHCALQGQHIIAATAYSASGNYSQCFTFSINGLNSFFSSTHNNP